MELTTTQIHRVEQFLESKNINYIDLKVEILDHIISDIENYIEKGHSFEDAYVMVKIRWEKYFRETTSFYFGMFYSNSKIIINKVKKIFKPFYFLYLTAYFLPFIFLKLTPIAFSERMVNFINGFLFSFSAILFLYMAFIMVKTMQYNVKTTYSFIMKTQYFGLILLIMGLAVGVFSENGELNPVFTGFVCGGYVVVFICHHFYKKHIAAIEKYKIA